MNITQLQCNLCDSKIHPYCPNPDEIMWMCENEDCMFPFNEDPLDVKEVCSLQPKYSSDSLIKQVQLLQGDRLEGEVTNEVNSTLAQTVRVQLDILDNICKVQSLLTESHHKRDPVFSYNSLNDSDYMDEDPIDQLFGNYDEPSEKPSIAFSVGSEPIFRVEKVCRRPFYTRSSFTDLDSASDKVSACASIDGIDSELAEDAEMEMEQDSFTLNDSNDREPCIVSKTMSQWVGSNPTYSCTHSYAE